MTNNNTVNNQSFTREPSPCKVIKAILSGDTFREMEGIDWGAVFYEMEKHKVAGLIGNRLADLNISDELEDKWKRYIISQRGYYDRLLSEQAKVCELLQGLPIAVIKGSSAAMYYPDPSLRTMGDIDILVQKGYHDKARKILESCYQHDNSYEARHSCFRTGNTVTELHKMVGTNLGSKVDEFDDVLFEAMSGVELCEIGGYKFPVLPKTENGLVILNHIAQHLQDGVGLRHVVDWFSYVADKEPVDWDRFNRVTKQVGIYKFQCVITKMCEMYLGLEATGDIDWCKDTDEALCDKLMEYVLSRGNFGRAVESYAGKFAMTNVRGNVLKRLQIGGLCRWKAAAKYKVLRPFAWAYQAVRIIREVLDRDDPVQSIKADMAEAENVKTLLDELGLERHEAMRTLHENRPRVNTEKSSD